MIRLLLFVAFFAAPAPAGQPPRHHAASQLGPFVPPNPNLPTPSPAPFSPPAPAPVVPVATLTAPASAAEGEPIILYADSSNFVGKVRWKVKPKTPMMLLDQNGRGNVVCIVQNPTPGTYRFDITVKGTALTDDGFDDDSDSADVVVEAKPKPKPVPPAPAPAPTPTPSPVPDPAPAPVVPPAPVVGKGWHATLVVDPSSPAEAQKALAPLADSITVAASVATLGGHWHRVAVGSAEYAAQNLAPALARSDASGPAVTAPAIVVQDATGKVIAKAASPATEAATLTYLKTLAGGN